MQSQYKGGSGSGVVESGTTKEKEYLAVANKKKKRGWGLFLRVGAVVLSLAAAVVLGFDKQSTTVAMTLVPTLPAVDVPVAAKWHYLSAFVYFVVANAIACGYGAISILLISAGRAGKKSVAMMIVVFDLVMVVLLFSSFGAALAIGLIGHEGNSHVQWQKVCNVFQKFCHQGAVALLLSGGASLAFFLLVCVAILNLHKEN